MDLPPPCSRINTVIFHIVHESLTFTFLCYFIYFHHRHCSVYHQCFGLMVVLDFLSFATVLNPPCTSLVEGTRRIMKCNTIHSPRKISRFPTGFFASKNSAVRIMIQWGVGMRGQVAACRNAAMYVRLSSHTKE